MPSAATPAPRDSPHRKSHSASRLPASTYRLQLTPEFGFAEAADLAGYLSELGITHAYLSPILQAAPGSQHGYDVIDHSSISAELGGEEAFRYLAARFAGNGIGLVVDVVPNHMGIPVPEYLNRPLWSVLSGGQDSAYAHWFDVDWDAQGGRMLLPVLSRPLPQCIDEVRLSRLAELPGHRESGASAGRAGEEGWPDGDLPVLHYQGHVLPVRPGTEGLPMPELLAAQCYRLDSWRAAATELNWRRFFDINSLIAIRVEEPDVFAATHGLLLGLVAEGLIDGLRIDHPDGLADPRDYLRQLATAARGSWIVAEKILAAGEELPGDWLCAGTTGYDALAAVGQLFTDGAGAQPLAAEYARFTADPADFASTAQAARREVTGQQLNAEVGRLVRLAGRLDEPGLARAPADDLANVMAELLAAFDVYRAYVVPGEAPPHTSRERVAKATAEAKRRLPVRLRATADLIAALLLGRGVAAGSRPARDELIVRFQQTCAAVQAKGVEDTASYRWPRLVSANEVGADPDQPGRSLAGFHAFARRLSEDWPATMTTLSTHDTKRQEDVRSRLAVLAESPAAWAAEVTAWHARASGLPGARPPDPPTEYLMWQTLVGAWPIDDDRLTAYLRKAMREAKLTTSWTDPDSGYESAAISFIRRAVADSEIAERVAAFVAWIGPDAAANTLGAKLVQLTMPGVPDLYQGCELTGLALVDPDNRRPVDFEVRRAMLSELGPGNPVDQDSLDGAKLLVTSRALRLRRDHPGWFAGDYQPVTGNGAAAAHVVAFCRSGQVITVATRLPARLRRSGGWRDTALAVPAGRWHDVLTGAEYLVTTSQPGDGPIPGADSAVIASTRLMLSDLMRQLPVALLIRAEAGEGSGQAAADQAQASQPRARQA
ncbi:MAG TPA: malto-oligosyltrehalose synthase [Streptosporangiaceae bacterium]|nr:malto-oligosyltrehalose synthase [Streptosporangiaceae bacterium]